MPAIPPEREAACVLVQSDKGRLLGVKRPDGFGLPGGSREASDGDLAEAAAREALEETGLSFEPGKLVRLHAERRPRGAWSVTYLWPEPVSEPALSPAAPGDGLGCAWVEPWLLTDGSVGPYNRRLLEVYEALSEGLPRQGGCAVRPVLDRDSEALFGILGAVFAEYEGCILDRSELPELERPASSFEAMGGAMWVAERSGRVVAFVAMAPSGEAGLIELKKLYALAEVRGSGLGRRLVELVEHEARRRGAERVHLWSDTRFLTAHAVYERLGYRRLPETRPLHDVSSSIEFHFDKRL